jgi:hypothetical protein
VIPTFPYICAIAHIPLHSCENRWDVDNADRHAHFRSIAHSLASLFQRRHRAWERMLIWRPRTLAMPAGLLNGTERLICRRSRVSPVLAQSNQRHPETRTTSSFFRKIDSPASSNPEVCPPRLHQIPSRIPFPNANASPLPAPTSQPHTPTYPSSSPSPRSPTQTSPTKSPSSK